MSVESDQEGRERVLGGGQGDEGQESHVEERYVVLGGFVRKRRSVCVLTVQKTLDPRKYKRRPGGTARKVKAGGTGVVTSKA